MILTMARVLSESCSGRGLAGISIIQNMAKGAVLWRQIPVSLYCVRLHKTRFRDS